MRQAIQVPKGFVPRPYQKALYNSLDSGKKRAIAVWHRRAGKDKVFVSMLAAHAIRRTGIYFYILPTYKQARKVIWDGLDSRGVKNLDVFPAEIIQHTNKQEMVLTLINGSMIYFLGSDNIDSIVGTNPIGIFFSEYSLHKPHVWDFLRPILVENGGFAVFNGTPRGKNHMYRMLEAAKNKPEEWYSEVLTIEDTGVMTPEQVENEITNGMDRATATQEFYCSFEAALQGAYYDEAMARMEAEGRLAEQPIDSYAMVNVAWDLGISDTMVLTLFQEIAGNIHVIDTIANNGKGLDWYVKQLQDKPYVYGQHFLPHDIKVRELGNGGKTRLHTLYTLGLKNLIVVPKSNIDDGINEVRKMLNRMYIHRANCSQLVEALKTYRKQWDSDLEVFTKQPVHDWSSHYADSMRTLVMGYRGIVDRSILPGIADGTGYNPLLASDTQARQQGDGHIPWAPQFTSMQADWDGQAKWNPLEHTYADGYYSR